MDPPFDTSSNDSWDQKDWSWHPYKMQAKRLSSRNSKSKNKPRSCKAPLVCQVEDCNNDLSTLKAYHRRYKICKHHLKVKFIVKDGIQQRFCQQCGRFHDIHEFDGLKRSCRLRLMKHNERRRKKPSSNRNRPESAISGRTTSSLSIDDSKLDTGEEACLYDEDYPDPDASPIDSPLFSSSSQHPYLPVLPSALHRQGINPPLRVELTSSRVNDALSDSPTETNVSDPLLEVYRNFTQNCDPTEFLQTIQSNEDLMPTIPEINPFRQSIAPPLTMPLNPQVFLGQHLMDPVAFLTHDRSISKQTKYKGEVHENIPWSKNCGSHRTSSVGSESESMNLVRAAAVAASLQQPPTPSAATTRHSFSENERLAAYQNVIKLTSLSVKIFSCTPKSLPPELRSDLTRAVLGGWCPEGSMREGCVYLNFDIFQPKTKYPLNLEGVIERLVASQNSSFWKDTKLLVQLNNESMFVSSGFVAKRFNSQESPDIYPKVQRVSPVCVVRNGTKNFTIKGVNLYSDDISIHCRIQGKFVATAAVRNKGEMESCCFSIAEDLPVGAVKVEVSKQGFIDNTMVVLSVDDKNVVTEIEAFYELYREDLDTFIPELGLLLELRSWLMDISERSHTTVDRIRTLLQYSFRSQNINHLSFKRCSRAEFNCLLLSAQRLFCYCDQQGLRFTRNYVWPVIWLASGDVYIEKTITSILDDFCRLFWVWKTFKIPTSFLSCVSGVKGGGGGGRGNLLLSST
eukprot:g8623.t1